MTKERLEQYRLEIENYLEHSCFVDQKEPQQKLFSAMRYSLLSGGKRLRPVLVYEFCRLCGGDWKKATPFAAAIEMIHTYSLIHDDLPCMDNDDYRRGKRTNHKVYGEALATLAGDGLLTAAFSQLAKAEYSAEARIRAVDILSNCAGELGMVGGQVLDMDSEHRECTEQEIYDIQSRKTGGLLRAACMMGVVAGEGTEAQLRAASDFADRLGLAFQIRDDLLDVIGDANVLGKAVGADGNKNTFLRIHGLRSCQELVEKYTTEAISALEAFSDTDWLRGLSLELTQRKS